MQDKGFLYDYWATVNSTKGNHYPKKIKEKKPFDAKVFALSCVVGFLIWYWLIGQY